MILSKISPRVKWTLFISIVGFFYAYCSNVQLINTNSNNNILCESINKEPSSSCESVDDISK